MSTPATSRAVLVVALGGVLGALARYGMTASFPREPAQWPWPVLLINVLGGLGIGILMGRLDQAASPSPYLRLFIGVGVLGGFTTQSASSLDGYHLLDAGRPVAALSYLLLTLAGALIATAAGAALAGGLRPGEPEPELDEQAERRAGVVTVLAVALGAAAGAPCRYLLDRFVQSRHRSSFPWGLVVVNLLGSLILGLISGFAGRRELPEWLVLGAATGWCGAFTTYSSFGYETLQLGRARRTGWAIANAVVTVAGGLAAVAIGIWAGQAFGA